MAKRNIGHIAHEKKAESARVERINILATLYYRGYTFRQMVTEVKARLNLKTYGLATCKRDIDYMIEDFRKDRCDEIEHNRTLELHRIDNLVREAWDAWDKSKEDYQKSIGRQVGVPVEGEGAGENGIAVVKLEQMKEDVRACGDPRYIDTINRLLMERRKILGLYAAEKKKVTGVLSFEAALKMYSQE